MFAIEPNVGMPLHWHFDGAWSKQVVTTGPPLHRNSNNGFAAVSPAPGRIELFAITGDAQMTKWSLSGTTFLFKQLPMGLLQLPDGVPAVVAGPGGRLDLFAIGSAANALTGGPLVHWRFNRKWSEPVAYDANLAAGGVTAARVAAGLDVFGFNAGTDNSLQHWPGGIGGSSTNSWANWVNNWHTGGQTPTHTIEGHCYPTSLDELVAIIKTAAQQNKHVRAVGSSWSFPDIAVTSGYVVETNKIDKPIPDTVVPNALLATHATSPQPHHLVHIEAGIQLENLMTILDRTNRAPYTMGGAAGQTLAGVISTSVHGSHFRLPPFPDWVRAIHLVGPDGREHWIEPKDRPITDETKLQAALGPDVQIHYDDDWFDSALVTVGGLGIIYSVVLQVKEQYKLTETLTAMKWLAPLGLREQLADGRWFATADDAVQFAIDPGSMGGTDPDCYLSQRLTVPMSTSSTPGTGSFDPLTAFCEGDIILDLLFLAAKELGKPEIIVPALAFVLPSIPAVVAVVALFPPVLAVLGLAATITATIAAAIPGLVALLKAAGPGAVGDVVGAVLDKHPEFTAYVMRELTKTYQPLGTRTDIAHQLMAPRNKGECAVRCFALETAFDTADQSHIAFIDAALAMLKDEAAMGHVLGGYFAIRFIGRSRAILSPHRSALTCTVEVVGLRTLSSTKVLLGRLESLGRTFGGIQRWGMFEDLKYEDVARSYPRLDTWLRVRNQLTNNGAIRTFDNAFMERCGLIPTAQPKILLRNPNDGAIYVIYGGAKFHVPDPTTLTRLFAGVPVRDAQAGELEHIGKVPGDGTLLQEETTGKVFVIYSGAKFHVPNWDTLTRLFPGFFLRPLWGGAIDHIPDCPADGTFFREESSMQIYIIAGCRKTPAVPTKTVHVLWDGALAHSSR